MPYILAERRNKFSPVLDELLSKLYDSSEEELGGDLNYCIYYLCKRLVEDKTRYVRMNTIAGALSNCQDELYRRVFASYEDKKIEENGDV